MILILAIIIVGIAFAILPSLLDGLVDAYDEWQSVIERIKRRANH